MLAGLHHSSRWQFRFWISHCLFVEERRDVDRVVYHAPSSHFGVQPSHWMISGARSCTAGCRAVHGELWTPPGLFLCLCLTLAASYFSCPLELPRSRSLVFIFFSVCLGGVSNPFCRSSRLFIHKDGAHRAVAGRAAVGGLCANAIFLTFSTCSGHADQAGGPAGCRRHGTQRRALGV